MILKEFETISKIIHKRFEKGMKRIEKNSKRISKQFVNYSNGILNKQTNTQRIQNLFKMDSISFRKN